MAYLINHISELNSSNIEENLDIQSKYYRILDKLIDAVVVLRYEKNRDCLPFWSNNQIHNEMLSYFSKVDSFPKDYILNQLAEKIAISTKKYNHQEEYFQKLKYFYHTYRRQHYLNREETTVFYNEILNQQRSSFCQLEKSQIIYELKEKLPLCPKKEREWTRTLQIRIMKSLFQQQSYEKMNLTKEDIQEQLDKVHLEMNHMKYFQKHGMISESEFASIDTLFLSGLLDKDTLKFYTDYDLKTIHIIVNHYYRSMISHLDSIEVRDNEIKPDNVSYHYNHLLIVSRKQYEKNLEEILFLATEKKIDMNIFNLKENQEILKLLPLVNLIEEFDSNMMLSILKNSKVVMKKMEEKNPCFGGSLFKILDCLDEIMSLSLSYDNADDLTISALGLDTVKRILDGNGNSLMSRNPKDYVELKQGMLMKTKTVIPPISGVYQNYTFESGKSDDSNRLLIGLSSTSSCLGPKAPGQDAFYKVLVEEDADVLLIKDEKGELVARSLMFRKNNFIMMTPFQGRNNIQRQFYQSEFLSQISNELLSKSFLNGDCIDYVLLTNDLDCHMTGYPIVTNQKFVTDFPYCDLYEEAYLIGSRKDIFHIEETNPKYYWQTRKKVCHKESDFESDIKRVRAFNILMSKEENKEILLDENLSDANGSYYQEIYIGQDWYLAITQDDMSELLTLDTNDNRQQEEIKIAISGLLIGGNKKDEFNPFSKVKK